MPCCFDPRSIRRRQDRSMERVALLRRGLALEGVTVGYNALEGIVAIAAGLVAGSVALTGFGIDSGIEGTSGVVLWWRLRADAHETIVCAWLSATTLLGLGLNAVLGWWWADPVAALAMLPLIVREGIEAWRAERTGGVPRRAARG